MKTCSGDWKNCAYSNHDLMHIHVECNYEKYCAFQLPQEIYQIYPKVSLPDVVHETKKK